METYSKAISAYLSPLSDAMVKIALPENAEPMSRYMQNKFPFFGIKSPERKEVLRLFLKGAGRPPDYRTVVREMWDLPEREWQYNAIAIGVRCKNEWQENDWELFEHCILNKSWWDSVDAISTEWVATFFDRYPHQKQVVTERWLASEDLWLRRTIIIFQRQKKEKTDVELLIRSIVTNLDSTDFFIQKGIGWALRSYAAVNPAFVADFVATNPLKPLSKREALKGVNRTKK